MNSSVGSGVSGVRVTYRSSFASQLLAVRYVMFGRIRKSPSSRAAQASAESCARTDADAAASNTAMSSFFFIDPPREKFSRRGTGRFGGPRQRGRHVDFGRDHQHHARAFLRPQLAVIRACVGVHEIPRAQAAAQREHRPGYDVALLVTIVMLCGEPRPG